MSLGNYLPYLAVYNEYFFAQSFKGKIRMLVIHGYNDYIPGNNDPMYNGHKNMSAHYTRQNMVCHPYLQRYKQFKSLLWFFELSPLYSPSTLDTSYLHYPVFFFLSSLDELLVYMLCYLQTGILNFCGCFHFSSQWNVTKVGCLPLLERMV